MKKYLVQQIMSVQAQTFTKQITAECSLNSIDKTPAFNWANIPALHINKYPWYSGGLQQKTHVKICRSLTTLFLQITAEDKYSYAKQTQLNHMLICQDSCVEFFFSPSGIFGSAYINMEVNCCGAFHIAYGTSRNSRKFISAELAKKIACDSNISTQTKVETDNDKSWILEIAIPLDIIEKLTGELMNTEKWFANFYRCGGRKAPQYSVWNNIITTEPDFHRPEQFGELIFTT